MRVLHVVEATVGGVRRHVYTLVCGLDRERFTVAVACPRQREHAFGDTQFVHDLEQAQVAVVPVAMQRSINPLNDSRALLQLIRVIRAGKFDIVHTHSSKAGFVGRLAARIVGTPKTIYTPNSLYFASLHSPLKRRFYLLLEQLAGRLSDRIVAVSASEYELLVQHHISTPQKIVCIDNGTDTPVLADTYDRARERQLLGQVGDGLLIGCVARLTAQKNPLLFVNAAARLLQTMPDARFVWCGEGELRAEAAARAEHHGIAHACQFIGHRDDAAPVLAAFDVFWLPSAYEGMPYVLLEALAIGVPVIATDVVGSRDVLRNNAGLLVPPNDATAFARATTLLVQQPALRESIVRAGYAYYHERGTATRMVRATEQLYEDVMAPDSVPQCSRPMFG